MDQLDRNVVVSVEQLQKHSANQAAAISNLELQVLSLLEEREALRAEIAALRVEKDLDPT